MSTVVVNDLDPATLRTLLSEHGSIAATARHLEVPETTLRDACRKHGLTQAKPRTAIPHVTKDMLDEALLPPNNCQVARLLDAIRDANQPDTLATVETMLALPARELPADQFRKTLEAWGFPADLIPDKNHVATHRTSSTPCRCASYAAVKERAL